MAAILVTGAYGLIGHAAVLALRDGGYEVVATDRLTVRPGDATFEAVPLTIAGVGSLAAFFARHEIDAIVHASGISGPMVAHGEPHTIFSVNAGGTLDLLEAARLSGVRRVVHLSSASVYGATSGDLIHEDSPLRAASPYGCSKIAGEAIARAYAGLGPEVVILRPSWVYGPRRRTPCVIRNMVTDALATQPTRLPFGGGFPRQFVHVDDVAGAVRAALKASEVSGQAFNISDGCRQTIDAVGEIVTSILPSARVTVDPGPDPDDDEVGLLDISAAAEHLDWRPSLALGDGVRAYAAALAGGAPPTPGGS